MIPRWLETCCDFLAPRFSAEGTASRSYTEPEFADLLRRLLANGEFRLRWRKPDEAVLFIPGRRVCNLQRAIPTLRYHLRRDGENRLHAAVSEHVLLWSAKGQQAQAMRQLCQEKLAQFLALLNELSGTT
jgi:hypothetical protein